MTRKIAALLLALSLTSQAFSNDAEHKGRVTLKLKTIKALTQSGSPDYGHDEECRATFGNLLKRSVTTHYDINMQTLTMSANSTFQGTQYVLNALGIAGKYAFGVFKPISKLPLYAVLFEISTQFTNPSSTLNLNLNGQTNCQVSSK